MRRLSTGGKPCLNHQSRTRINWEMSVRDGKKRGEDGGNACEACHRHGATRVYSGYNTCSLLIFQSDERVICGVLDNQLQPGVNRYTSYLAQVDAAPYPPTFSPSTPRPSRLSHSVWSRMRAIRRCRLPAISFITMAPICRKIRRQQTTGKSKIVNYCQQNDFNCHIT